MKRLAIIACVALAGCGPSMSAVQNAYPPPPAPAHLAKAGKVVPLPKDAQNVAQPRELVARIRRSELANARAVRQWREHYANVKRRAEGAGK